VTSASVATVCPLTKVTFCVPGSVTPSGYAVMVPPAVGAVTVRFSTAACAPAGIVPTPATLSLTVPPAAMAPAGAPVPLRVSSRRVGP